MIHRCSRAARIVALAAVVALGACASSGAGAVQSQAFATLVIRNDAMTTVNVYALRSGSRQRLGTLRGLATGEFPIRRTMLGPGNQLDLLVDPVGSRQTYRSQPIYVVEGDVVELAVSALIR